MGEEDDDDDDDKRKGDEEEDEEDDDDKHKGDEEEDDDDDDDKHKGDEEEDDDNDDDKRKGNDEDEDDYPVYVPDENARQIIFRLDDVQDYWPDLSTMKGSTSENIIKVFLEAGVPLAIGVIGGEHF